MTSSQIEPLPSSSDKSKLFKCSYHANNISTKLQEFYKEKDFLDIVLIAEIDKTKLEAHRIVLSASSDYFLAMFRSSFMEAKACEIELKEVDGITLKLILDFMYTATMELRFEIVENVLRTADFFQMSTLIAACCEFMSEQLDVSNCLGIAFFAEQHNYTALMEKSLTFAYTHFDQVCGDKEFLQLNKDQLIKFISTDEEEQYPRSEEKLFLSIVAWVENDKGTREDFIFDLMSQVRYTLLTPEFIVKRRKAICSSVEFIELTDIWIQWHFTEYLLTSSRIPQPIPTPAAMDVEKLILVSASVRSNNQEMWIFDSQLDSWSSLNVSNDSILQYSSGLIFKNQMLIIVGIPLSNHHTHGSSPLCFHLERNQWSCLPATAHRHRSSGMAELNGELYVFGGDGICQVEKYNFQKRKWRAVAPLPRVFERIQVAVLNGLLYAVGNDSLIMGCYNPNENKWTQKPFRCVGIYNFGFAVVKGYLYAAGGSNADGTQCEETHVYDSSNDTWMQINLRVTGGYTICTSLNNRLVIYEENSNSLNEYNPETVTVQTLASLPQNVHQHPIIMLISKCKIKQ